MLRTLSIFLLVIASLAKAQDYYVYKLPPQIVEYRLEKIQIETNSELVFGKLPKHPKITWLQQSNRRIGNNLNLNTLDFVVTAPGLLEFPPIPIIYESKEFFIRLDDVRVLRNPVSKSDTRFTVYWNGADTPPEQVHLGEAVEVSFVEMVQTNQTSYGSATLSAPSNRINGGQWHQYIEVPGRRAHPQDFFYNYARGFWDGGNRNFLPAEKTIDGIDYELRTYKARLYFTELGKATGHLSATLGTTSSQLRTHVIPVDIEVLPLPPLPNSRALDSGLVGRWNIQASVSPPNPRPSQQLSIRLAVRGLGNPKLRNKFDFSGEGFPSVESNWHFSKNANYDEWNAIFEQTLIPTGKVGTLPARTIAYFDTEKDDWQLQEIIPSITLPGFTDVTASLAPRSTIGKSITRPVLLNLPAATFAAFALAPFLPFLFGLAKKRKDSRDPVLEARRKKLQKLISSYQSGQADPSSIDDDLLPLLRDHLGLPGGATTREVADALSDHELSALLKQHAESSFSTTAKSVDLKALATRLAKLSFLFIVCFANLRAETLDEANSAFQASNFLAAAELYEKLIQETPGAPSLYFNLAQARLSADDPARARAACHTAILLDPLNQEAHDLMSEIRERQGDETVSGSRFLSLRPDQWLTLAAIMWITTFLYFGIRKFRPLPFWPGLAILAFAFLLAGTGIWKQFHAYTENQYMVLADELPRELEAGTPNWDYPALRAGQIVTVSEVTATHALVSSSEKPFWLPVHELQQVW